MPTYEYACKSCGEHLEIVQSFKDEPLTECPTCGGPLRKVFGSIGISFKGDGFYRTDSRPKPKAEKSEKSDKSEKSEKTEKKAETSTKSSDTKSSDTKSSDSKGKTEAKSA